MEIKPIPNKKVTQSQQSTAAIKKPIPTAMRNHLLKALIILSSLVIQQYTKDGINKLDASAYLPNSISVAWWLQDAT
jgi:hypothetical protein